jgi:hypothetical protein
LRFERNNYSCDDETRAFAAELIAGISTRRSTAAKRGEDGLFTNGSQ